MEKIQEFYQDWMFALSSLSDGKDLAIEQLFFDDSLKILIEGGHSFEGSEEDGESIDGYKYTPFKSRGLRIDGYEYIKDRQIINLYVCDFNKDPSSLKTITQTEINQLLSNTKNFFEKSMSDGFIEQLEDEDQTDVIDVAQFIYDFEEKISEVNFVLITNCIISKSIKSLLIEPKDHFSGLPTYIEVWDIGRFYANEDSKEISESIVIEFVKPIPTLNATLDVAKYHSYLCIIPGEVLAEMYKKHGARLLESNVRSFLQFRSNVNKGIRNTLLNDPDMFFAYNNGITITASSCEQNSQGNIISLTNLQIVNGGQTTAALFHALKNGVNLEGVFVQTKLSILDDIGDEDIIPNISKFANLQNKINDSDFFSNHPFHRNMEAKSRRIAAPVKEGEVRATKWFYERSRGQYLTEQGKLTPTERKSFNVEHPKAQLLTKTDLGKTSVIFFGQPNRAVQGINIAFMYFAKNIQKDWEANENLFNDMFYKKLIAQQIMFINCRLLAMETAKGNVIQPITAYSLFMLNELSNSSQYSLPFLEVWNNQKIPVNMEKQLLKIISFITDFFNSETESVEGRSILSFSKSKGCLDLLKSVLKEIDIEDFLISDYKKTLRSNEDLKSDKSKAIKDEVIANEMELTVKLLKLNWEQVISYAKNNDQFYENDISLLSVFPRYMKGGIEVTPKQLAAINKILVRLKEEGLDI
jgi:hypothetical protein